MTYMPHNDNYSAVLAALDNHKHIVFAEIAERLITLGREEEWTMDDNFETTETVAGLARMCGLPRAGDQDDAALEFWRATRYPNELED